jgi:CRISPR-associated protein Csm3
MKISKILAILTGLHIGGADDTMKIGGVDSPVIRRSIKWNRETKRVDLVNGEILSEPYIPGSSLKGKIRSLLEHEFGLHRKLLIAYRKKVDNLEGYYGQELEKEKEKIRKDVGIGESINSKKHLKYFDEKEKKYAKLIIKLFGEGGGESESDEITIPRLVFRDAFITDEIREKYLSGDIELTEEKFENVIDRFSGKTKTGGLRQIERVVPGVEFKFEVVIRKLDENDDTELFEKVILLGMKLLEEDYLGGNGTRGYGKVEFIEKIDESVENLKNEINKKLGITQ